MTDEQKTEATQPIHEWDEMLGTMGAGLENAQEFDQTESKADELRKLNKFQGTIDETYPITVKDGHGAKTTAKKVTAWAHPHGTFTITAPDSGTWHLKVTDLENTKHGPIIDKKGLAEGQAVKWDYRTGFKTQLKIEASWSDKADTTLKVHVKATY